MPKKLPFGLGCDPEFAAGWGGKTYGHNEATDGVQCGKWVGRDADDVIELRPEKAESVEGAVASLKAAIANAAKIAPYAIVSRSKEKPLGGHIHVQKPDAWKDGMDLHGLALALCTASVAARGHEDFAMSMRRGGCTASGTEDPKRMSELYRSRRGYGGSLDWRNGGGIPTIEVRGQSAEWTSCPETARAMFSLMAAIRWEYEYGTALRGDCPLSGLLMPFGIDSLYGDVAFDTEGQRGALNHALDPRSRFRRAVVDAVGATLDMSVFAKEYPDEAGWARMALDTDAMRRAVDAHCTDVAAGWKVAVRKPTKARLSTFAVRNGIVSVASYGMREAAAAIYAATLPADMVKRMERFHLSALATKRGIDGIHFADIPKRTVYSSVPLTEAQAAEVLEAGAGMRRGGIPLVLMLGNDEKAPVIAYANAVSDGLEATDAQKAASDASAKRAVTFMFKAQNGKAPHTYVCAE